MTWTRRGTRRRAHEIAERTRRQQVRPGGRGPRKTVIGGGGGTLKQHVKQNATVEETHDHHDIGGGTPNRTACDGVGTGRSVRSSREFNDLVCALAVSGLH